MSCSISFSTTKDVDEVDVTRTTTIGNPSELDHKSDINYSTSIYKSQNGKSRTIEGKSDYSGSIETLDIAEVNGGTSSHSYVDDVNEVTTTAPAVSPSVLYYTTGSVTLQVSPNNAPTNTKELRSTIFQFVCFLLFI